jgi:hypothetical protein
MGPCYVFIRFSHKGRGCGCSDGCGACWRPGWRRSAWGPRPPLGLPARCRRCRGAGCLRHRLWRRARCAGDQRACRVALPSAGPAAYACRPERPVAGVALIDADADLALLRGSAQAEDGAAAFHRHAIAPRCAGAGHGLPDRGGGQPLGRVAAKRARRCVACDPDGARPAGRPRRQLCHDRSARAGRSSRVGRTACAISAPTRPPGCAGGWRLMRLRPAAVPVGRCWMRRGM